MTIDKLPTGFIIGQLGICKPIRYNTCLGRIRAIVRYAVYKEIMATDVTAGMKDIRNARKAKKRALTLSERQLINKAELNAFEYCYINLLLYTGMRKCEALALIVSDIGFKKKRIEVSKTLVTSKKMSCCLQEYTKTTAGKRYIPIPNVLLSILIEYTSKQSGILFNSSANNYIGLGSFNGRWDQILRKLQTVSKRRYQMILLHTSSVIPMRAIFIWQGWILSRRNTS